MSDRTSEMVADYKNMRELIILDQDKEALRHLLTAMEQSEKEIETLQSVVSTLRQAILDLIGIVRSQENRLHASMLQIVALNDRITILEQEITLVTRAVDQHSERLEAMEGE